MIIIRFSYNINQNYYNAYGN